MKTPSKTAGRDEGLFSGFLFFLAKFDRVLSGFLFFQQNLSGLSGFSVKASETARTAQILRENCSNRSNLERFLSGTRPRCLRTSSVGGESGQMESSRTSTRKCYLGPV